MERIILAALAAFMFVGTATAADIRQYPQIMPRVTVAPPASWAGPYIGAYAGYGWNTHTRTEAYGSYRNVESKDFKGAKIGGLVGVNWQSGIFVYGVEVDAGMNLAKHRTQDQYQSYVCYENDGCWGYQTTHTRTTKKVLEGSAILRAGVLVTDSTLAYAGGGLAWSRVKVCDHYIEPYVTSHSCGTDNALGWKVVAGVEQRFGNWSTRLEYGYRAENLRAATSGCSMCSHNWDTRINLHSHEVRGMVVRKF